MVRTGLARVVVTLGVMLVYASTADAQLPKRGAYSGNFGYFDTGKAIVVEEGRLVWHGIGQGPFFNDAGEGFLHLAVVVCPGHGLIDSGRLKFSGYCTVTDQAGEKAFLEWRCDGGSGDADPRRVGLPRCAGTFDWRGGTGKYTGLKGRNSFHAGGIGEGLTGPVGYAVWKGEWELP